MRLPQLGFTLVELLITIAVVAAVASIATISYAGVQRKAATAAVLDTLTKATEQVLLADVKNRAVPDDISGLYEPRSDTTVNYHNTTLHGGLPYYDTLTAPQNGKLLYDICRELVTAGVGRGKNDFGENFIDYISACNVYDTNYLQINGWNGGFNVSSPSVTEAMLQGYVDTAASNHPSHPTYVQTLQDFMNSLINRHKAQGGTFPITSFWQPWIGQPALPTPSRITGSTSNFCLVVSSVKYDDVSYVTSKDNPTPRPGVGCEVAN